MRIPQEYPISSHTSHFPPSPLTLALFSYLVFSYCLLVMLYDEYGMLVVYDDFLALSQLASLARRGPVT